MSHIRDASLTSVVYAGDECGAEKMEAHHEVKAVAADRVGVIGEHQSSLVGVEEGGQAQHEGRVHGAVAALGAPVVAGVQQLVFEVRVVDEALVRQLAAAPQLLLELVVLRVLQTAGTTSHRARPRLTNTSFQKGSADSRQELPVWLKWRGPCRLLQGQKL